MNSSRLWTSRTKTHIAGALKHIDDVGVLVEVGVGGNLVLDVGHRILGAGRLGTGGVADVGRQEDIVGGRVEDHVGKGHLVARGARLDRLPGDGGGVDGGGQDARGGHERGGKDLHLVRRGGGWAGKKRISGINLFRAQIMGD